MKTWICCFGAALYLSSHCLVQGQGTVTFANSATTLFQYADNTTGYTATPIPVGDGRVELLWAPLGTTDINLFQVLGASVAVGPSAGRFIGGTRTIPAGSGYSGIAPGDSVSLYIRGWKGAYNTWTEATMGGFMSGAYIGWSVIFTVDTGNPTTTPAEIPASIVGPGGFSGLVIPIIPEPSGGALCCLGGLIGWLTRRK